MNYESIRSVDQIPARMNAHHIKEMGARAMLGLKVAIPSLPMSTNSRR